MLWPVFLYVCIYTLGIDNAGHSTPSLYDYLCEASQVSGFEAAVRAGPLPEAKLISVGEHPIIALYKLTKVIISFVCLVHYMKMTNLLTQIC